MNQIVIVFTLCATQFSFFGPLFKKSDFRKWSSHWRQWLIDRIADGDGGCESSFAGHPEQAFNLVLQVEGCYSISKLS
jgi:hypothetical protein